MRDEQSGRGAVWSELKEHFKEQQIHADEKRQVLKLREKYEAEIQELIREQAKLIKQCHPTFNRLEDLEKGVKILNRRMETTVLSSQQESALLREIQ